MNADSLSTGTSYEVNLYMRASAMPKIDQKNVGMRLEALRLALDMTRAEFAQSFDLDPSSYTKTVNGEKALRSHAAFAIAEQWGVSMDYLFRGRLTDIDAALRSKILKNLNTQLE